MNFKKLEIGLKVGDLNLDFSSAQGRLIASIFGAIAEIERELIRARTYAGLKYARERGRVGGKPKGLSADAKKKAKEAYELRLNGLTVEQVLLATGIKSKKTLYKYIRYEAERLGMEKD